MFRITLVLLFVMLLVPFNPAIAERGEVRPNIQLSPDYPGKISQSSWMEWNVFWIQAVCQAYYSVHGKWPLNWQHACSDLGVAISLESPEGFSIDPDDGKLNHYGDVVLDSVSGQLHLKCLTGLDRPCEELRSIKQPGTFANEIEWKVQTRHVSGDPQVARNLLKLQQDTDAIRHLALAELLNDGLLLFDVVHGRMPADWNEYLASGLAPLDSRSNNAYQFDGSAGDFRWSSSGNASVRIEAVLKDGKVLPFDLVP